MPIRFCVISNNLFRLRKYFIPRFVFLSNLISSFPSLYHRFLTGGPGEVSKGYLMSYDNKLKFLLINLRLNGLVGLRENFWKYKGFVDPLNMTVVDRCSSECLSNLAKVVPIKFFSHF